MIKKAKTASSAEDLKRMAAEEGIELTSEEAGRYYEMLHSSGALSDDELDSVAGGKGTPSPKYKAGQKVKYIDGTTVYYGVIDRPEYSDFQKAWYYWVNIEDGRYLSFPLESPISPAKVIS